MVFHSYLFILLFLPIVISGYFLLNKICKYQLALLFLCIMSFLFYGFFHPVYLFFLWGSIVFNYIVYLLFQKLSKANHLLPYHELIRKIILIITILINISVLLYFKYFNFFIDTINLLFQTNMVIRNILLPLGISFITFQQIAFIIDAYRDEVFPDSSHFVRSSSTPRPYSKFLLYALFVSFFPRLSAGPIILHTEWFPLLTEDKRKKINWDYFANGLYLFAMGLGKKVIIADTFGKAVDWGYSNVLQLNTCSAVFVTVAYSIQIYFDFSGYSDMATGICRMLHLDLPLNFNSPYKAHTITEFWKRWHITLTRFLTKYLYIPLGGNRKGSTRMMINTMIVFFCSGLWHGASFTFILWGGLHGFYMILTKRGQALIDKIPKVVNWGLTLLFINFSWVLFRSGSFTVLKNMLTAIFQMESGGLSENICALIQIPVFHEILGSFCPYWLETALSLIIIGILLFRCRNLAEKAKNLKYSVFSIVSITLVLMISIMSLSGLSTFIYAYF